MYCPKCKKEVSIVSDTHSVWHSYSDADGGYSTVETIPRCSICYCDINDYYDQQNRETGEQRNRRLKYQILEEIKGYESIIKKGDSTPQWIKLYNKGIGCVIFIIISFLICYFIDWKLMIFPIVIVVVLPYIIEDFSDKSYNNAKTALWEAKDRLKKYK